ncbi:MAG: hypothetical protein ABWY35_05320 [Pseudorhodoplanes sp.]
MALDLDAFETWRAIAKEPDLFAPIRSEAGGTVRKLLVKMLKSKAVDLRQATDMRKALGKETFALLVDGMKDAEVKALVARFDRQNTEAKSASTEWRRRHLIDLVRGEVEAVRKPDKTARKATGKKAETAPPSHASAGAVRKTQRRT